MIAEKVKESLAWGELVAIGWVGKAQGRVGEVVVNPLTDFPERFAELLHLYMLDRPYEPRRFIVERARLHKGRPVVKLGGISSIDEAEALLGKEVRIPESDLLPLPEGSFYHFDIVGLSVEDRVHGFLGLVESIVTTGGTDLLVVRSRDGAEHLLPLCGEICGHIDPGTGRIEVSTPEGLIGLNEN